MKAIGILTSGGDAPGIGSLTLVIEDLLFKGLKSLNFFVKF